MDSSPNVPNQACEPCKKRKTKCDRGLPCGECKRHGRDCIPVSRPMKPRGRSARTGGNKAGPLPEHQHHHQQQQQLEDTASKIASHSPQSQLQLGSSTTTTSANSSGINSITTASSMAPTLGNHSLAQSPASDMSVHQYTSPSQILGFQASSPSQHQHPSSWLSNHQIQYLARAYTENVHPITNLVDASSFEAFLRDGTPYAGHYISEAPLRSLRSAALFAACCSLDDSECIRSFGRPKADIISRLREDCEAALGAAKLVFEHNILSLTALTLYLVAARSHRNDVSAWTLLAIAVRIAQSLNLHLESHISDCAPFEANIKRSLWYLILDIDLGFAIDRGSNTAISQFDYNTKVPTFNHATASPQLDRNAEKPWHYGFLSITYGTQTLMRKLNFVPPSERSSTTPSMWTDWELRRRVVVDFTAFMQNMVNTHLAGTVNAATMLSQMIILAMELVALRPLQRHQMLGTPPLALKKILATATSILEMDFHFDNSPHYTKVRWISRGYVMWHPLAVLLSELQNCAAHDEESVRKGWNAAVASFPRIKEALSEGPTGPIGTLLDQLVAKAYEAVQHRLEGGRPLASCSQQDMMTSYKLQQPAAISHDLADLNFASDAFEFSESDWDTVMQTQADVSWDVWDNIMATQGPT